ncbi:hypothetical protein ACS0TY_018698 [Phlomoides rotata]
MSHCGWSSVMESVYFGVPVVALPLGVDQPTNARFVVEAGVGVEVMRDEDGGFDGEGVAKAMNEVIVGERGEEFRRRAREMSEKMKMEEDEAIHELNEHETRDLAAASEHVTVEDLAEGFAFGVFRLSCDIVLIKSCRGIEGKYMDHLSTLCNKKIVPTGPLITFAQDQENADSDIIKWLSERGEHSTLYISFGSENYFSRQQIGGIAKGLEMSDANFIWVARSPAGSEFAVEEALPEGFLDRVKKQRGMVVDGWVPQTAILAHPSMDRSNHHRVAQVEESDAMKTMMMTLMEKFDALSGSMPRETLPPLVQDQQGVQEVNFMSRQNFQGGNYNQGKQSFQSQPQGQFPQNTQGRYNATSNFQGGSSSYNPNFKNHENFSYANQKAAVRFPPGFNPGVKLPTHEGKPTNEDALAMILKEMEGMEAQVTQMSQQQKAMDFQLGQLATTKMLDLLCSREDGERKKKSLKELKSEKGFEVGDEVVMYNSKLKRILGKRKLKRKWILIVKKVHNGGGLEVENSDGDIFITNDNQVKLFHPTIPKEVPNIGVFLLVERVGDFCYLEDDDALRSKWMVVRDEDGGFDGVGVAKAINEVIVEERGERFRRKAREISEKMKMEEDDAIHEVVEELSRICMMKRATEDDQGIENVF